LHQFQEYDFMDTTGSLADRVAKQRQQIKERLGERIAQGNENSGSSSSSRDNMRQSLQCIAALLDSVGGQGA
jgi:hypothetical protein